MLTLGRTHLGVSEETWVKQTLIFNVGMIPFFYQNSTGGNALFNEWVWQMQIGISVLLAIWGFKTMEKFDKPKKKK